MASDEMISPRTDHYRRSFLLNRRPLPRDERCRSLAEAAGAPSIGIILAAEIIVAALIAQGCAGGGTDPNAAVYDAWQNGRSRLEVTATGKITRLFGIRAGPSGLHEGFLVRLSGAAGHGLTVRVEDNVDITGLIPLSAGENVEVRGEYIYDESGGLIHFTHHDPRGRHAGGYVRVRDKVYL